ncbi:oligosaccharide flippase family protein [Metapseudomonas otitidis]|uniref:oligosaccharide flippase family protein n=1 Tax=Metapseudomonas otitidis TaxID=319939 RepID=UPI00209A9894|nr:oligosaccharide flippase family protein [Pseudomonas otitidis]MCO7557853.1 oligosaccharide flippase family protein [Pseudomonas otitidis]
MSAVSTISSRLRKSPVAVNTAYGFLSLGWTSLLSVISVPIYISILGHEEWGVVAACLSLQLLANFADSGFSQIVPRWIAKESKSAEMVSEYMKLFRGLYFIIALILLVSIQLLSGAMATSWFNVPIERVAELEFCLRVVSVQLFFQFLNNLNVGYWNGTQNQARIFFHTCSFVTLKHAVTILLLYFWGGSAIGYVIGFCIVACLELLFNTYSVGQGFLWGGSFIRRVRDYTFFLKEVSSLSGGIMIGLLVSQLDRIVLSKVLPAEQFGVYVVVLTLSQAFLQLQSPVNRAFFPVLVKGVSERNTMFWRSFGRFVVGVMLTATVPTLVAILFAGWILNTWLGNKFFVENGTFALQLLLLGVAINTLYGCIYQLMVASGRSSLVFKFNLASLVVLAIVVLSSWEGLVISSGGYMWVLWNSVLLLLGLGWLILSGRKIVG